MLSNRTTYVDSSTPATYNQNSTPQYIRACSFIDEDGYMITGETLDVGSGDGKVTAYIADKLNIPVTGVDISSDRVAFANTNYANSNLQFVVGNALALDDTPALSGKHYQAIVSFYTVHHFPKQQQQAFFHDVRAKLNDDGVALFLIPNGKNELIACVRRTEHSEKWAQYFTDFDMDAVRTYESAEYYSELARRAKFYSHDITEIKAQGVEMDFERMKKFISGWLPQLAHLKQQNVAEEIQNEFMNDVTGHYFETMQTRRDAKVTFRSMENKVVLYASEHSFFKAKKQYQAELAEAKAIGFGI